MSDNAKIEFTKLRLRRMTRERDDFCLRLFEEKITVQNLKMQMETLRDELNRLRRLTPTGTYTLNVAHEEELERMREALRAAEKRELEALAELDAARDLLQSVATACRGLGPRTDAVMSVVGNALAELDEQRANIETLKTHVETLREAWRSASDEVTRLRAESSTLTTDQIEE